MFTNAFLYEAVRTPFGRHAGSLSAVRPDDLMAGAIAALMARSGLPADQVDDVIVGCTNQAGEDCRNIGRRAALLAGLPPSVPGTTVNRLCASGLAAVVDAARAVSCGEGDLLVAGGVESMSRAPFVLGKSAKPFARDHRMFDSTTGSRFPNEALTARYGDDPMTATADTVGRELGIGREASDRFAMASQQKFARALADGFYADELVPVEMRQGRDVTVVASDEHPRANTTLEALARLPVVHDGGVVTAGNASGINDGAAALIVGGIRVAERFGCAPMARIVASGVAGVEPRIMGVGPVPASALALSRAGLTTDQLDVIEINEAFATQVLGCLKLLSIDDDDPRVNPNGGAIAIGHPLGASGARLAMTAARQLRRVQGRYALVSLCIGVGQGLAVVLERP